ncbi:hypothetical protein U1Q18_009947 [Sarracenia purpurea var. burkii]
MDALAKRIQFLKGLSPTKLISPSPVAISTAEGDCGNGSKPDTEGAAKWAEGEFSPSVNYFVPDEVTHVDPKSRLVKNKIEQPGVSKNSPGPEHHELVELSSHVSSGVWGGGGGGGGEGGGTRGTPRAKMEKLESTEEESRGASDGEGSTGEDEDDSDKEGSEDEEPSEDMKLDEAAVEAQGLTVIPNSEVSPLLVYCGPDSVVSSSEISQGIMS